LFLLFSPPTTWGDPSCSQCSYGHSSPESSPPGVFGLPKTFFKRTRHALTPSPAGSDFLFTPRLHSLLAIAQPSFCSGFFSSHLVTSFPDKQRGSSYDSFPFWNLGPPSPALRTIQLQSGVPGSVSRAELILVFLNPVTTPQPNLRKTSLRRGGPSVRLSGDLSPPA